MNKTGPIVATAAHFGATPVPSLQALLRQSIDYAGLFPPAELPLEPALKNHAAYVRGGDAWMLNTFVLPAGQFPTARPYFASFDSEHTLRISALGGKSENGTNFRQKLEAVATAIEGLKTADLDVAASVV